MARLVPPYLKPDDLRVRVVETDEWNASAMGNGAIWVYSGLLRAMSDDELAIILGHELAHFTHEHSRKGAKSSMIAQLLGLGAALGGEAIGGIAGGATQIGGLLGMTAFQSGYSRDMEDQADQVGLRYAFEGGYAVSAGPELWERFREKYGESDSISNFFIGSHSRPSDRIRNIEREITINYARAR
jgi:Zn-dependent protease with chaperone function